MLKLQKSLCVFCSMSDLTFEPVCRSKRDLEPEVSDNTEQPDGGRKAGISPCHHSSHFIVSCRSSSNRQEHAFEIQTSGAFYFGLFIFLVALTYAPRSYVTPRASAFEVWVVPLFLAFPGSEREIASLGKLFSSAARGTMVLLFIQRCGTERDGPVRSFSCRTNTRINVLVAQVEKGLSV